jgi:malate:Na+ symporter
MVHEQVQMSLDQNNYKGDDRKRSWLQVKIQTRIGVIPVPLYLILALLIYFAARLAKLPNNMIGGFAVIMIMGIVLSEIGLKAPVLKDIGGAAILALMIPSFMVFWNLLNPATLNAVTTLMTTANFLYLYIACLVVGSMLGMDRRTLIQGLMRILIPMVAGTIAAVAVGIAAGVLFGYTVHCTLFYIIIPIIAGGIGEGILPLSIAYGEILGQESATFVAQMIPAAVIGNVIAIIGAGLLKRLGERKPHLTGNGTLVKSGKDDSLGKAVEAKQLDLSLMGGGLLLACCFFTFGTLLSPYIKIPGPIIMIFAAALVKWLKLLPAHIEQGAFQMYKFITTNLTYPLLVGLGILYVPLKDVKAIVSIPYILICAAIVVAMVATGYWVGKLIGMYEVESAIVTGCRGGLGGTGDVAILSACDRMVLMPFAQISTRIGGASSVVLAVVLLRMWH